MQNAIISTDLLLNPDAENLLYQQWAAGWKEGLSSGAHTQDALRARAEVAEAALLESVACATNLEGELSAREREVDSMAVDIAALTEQRDAAVIAFRQETGRAIEMEWQRDEAVEALEDSDIAFFKQVLDDMQDGQTNSLEHTEEINDTRFTFAITLANVEIDGINITPLALGL